jgi:hypothetical protein
VLLSKTAGRRLAFFKFGKNFHSSADGGPEESIEVRSLNCVVRRASVLRFGRRFLTGAEHCEAL